jgi:hypothetical protein
VHQNVASEAEQKSDWVEIDSMSRFRKIVGGRFQNIRELWVGAGLPLIESKGEKPEAYTLDQSGWIRFSNWILKKGFEARLVPGNSLCFFEVRAGNQQGD